MAYYDHDHNQGQLFINLKKCSHVLKRKGKATK